MDGLIDDGRPDPPTLQEQRSVIRARARFQVLKLCFGLGSHRASLDLRPLFVTSAGIDLPDGYADVPVRLIGILS
jgi:hypothetical protein